MGGRVQGQKIYVRGFDTNDGEEKVCVKSVVSFGLCVSLLHRTFCMWLKSQLCMLCRLGVR